MNLFSIYIYPDKTNKTDPLSYAASVFIVVHSHANNLNSIRKGTRPLMLLAQKIVISLNVNFLSADERQPNSESDTCLTLQCLSRLPIKLRE